MKVVVAEILPLAFVVTISPINVIPVILLLFTSSLQTVEKDVALGVEHPSEAPKCPTVPAYWGAGAPPTEGQVWLR